jgi:hypothetical protein
MLKNDFHLIRLLLDDIIKDNFYCLNKISVLKIISEKFKIYLFKKNKYTF